MSFTTLPMSHTIGGTSVGAIRNVELHGALSDMRGNKTTFVFDLPRMKGVSLQVQTMSGQLVKDLVAEQRNRGRHAVTWDNTDQNGAPVPPGMYVVRMKAGTFSASQRFPVR
jgi:flagellar hook assembly protein FlgD